MKSSHADFCFLSSCRHASKSEVTMTWPMMYSAPFLSALQNWMNCHCDRGFPTSKRICGLQNLTCSEISLVVDDITFPGVKSEKELPHLMIDKTLGDVSPCLRWTHVVD